MGFILVGKVLGKAFRILGLNGRKGNCRWEMKQDFHGNFQVNLTYVHGFLPLSGASATESYSFWFRFIRLLHPAQSADIVVLDH